MMVKLPHLRLQLAKRKAMEVAKHKVDDVVKRPPFQGYYDSILPPEEPTQDEIDEAVYHWDGMKRMRDDE